MTTINSQEDFLRALDENPQWRDAVRDRILGQELLNLPARFEAFVQRMDAFIEQQVILNKNLLERMDRIEADVAQLKTDVAGIKTEMAGMKTDISGMKTEMAGDENRHIRDEDRHIRDEVRPEHPDWED